MSYKRLMIGAAAVLSACAAMPSAFAETTAAATTPQAPATEITKVQFYPSYGYGYGYGPYYGYGYGPYYGGGVIGIPGDIIAGTAAAVDGFLEGPVAGPVYAGGGIAACEQRFRSFDPATGTYTTYSGEQVVCPYLRW